MKCKMGRWVPPFKTDKKLSHGYCPECFDAEMKKLNKKGEGDEREKAND